MIISTRLKSHRVAFAVALAAASLTLLAMAARPPAAHAVGCRAITNYTAYGQTKVVDDTDYSMVNNTKMQIWDDLGGSNQRWCQGWSLQNGVQWWFFSNLLSGKCLDVATSNGRDVIQYACNLTPDKLWRLEPDFTTGIPNSYRLVNQMNGKCLDITNWNTNNGTKLQVFTCQYGISSWNQIWVVDTT